MEHGSQIILGHFSKTPRNPSYNNKRAVNMSVQRLSNRYWTTCLSSRCTRHTRAGGARPACGAVEGGGRHTHTRHIWRAMHLTLHVTFCTLFLFFTRLFANEFLVKYLVLNGRFVFFNLDRLINYKICIVWKRVCQPTAWKLIYFYSSWNNCNNQDVAINLIIFKIISPVSSNLESQDSHNTSFVSFN